MVSIQNVEGEKEVLLAREVAAAGQAPERAALPRKRELLARPSRVLGAFGKRGRMNAVVHSKTASVFPDATQRNSTHCPPQAINRRVAHGSRMGGQERGGAAASCRLTAIHSKARQECGMQAIVTSHLSHLARKAAQGCHPSRYSACLLSSSAHPHRLISYALAPSSFVTATPHCIVRTA